MPAGYFSREQAPNVLLTTCYRPSRLMYHFLADMLEVLPCATFYKRQVRGAAPPANQPACCHVGLPFLKAGCGIMADVSGLALLWAVGFT